MHTVSAAALPIGAGGFAAVYTLPTTQDIAFKVVKNDTGEHEEYLEAEFKMMNSTYHYRSTKPQAFTIPAPLAHYLPRKATFDRSPYSTSSTKSDCAPTSGSEPSSASIIDKETLEDLASSNAVYAMQRIPSLPEHISQALLGKFAPLHMDKHIILSRLYLGRDAPINRSRFFNSRNFPIDRPGYEQLREITGTDLPSSETVAHEMGSMLATIHSAGFDARDVEFVLAGAWTGSSTGDSWGLHTFDFNQMRPLNKETTHDVPLLVESFFLNDPYFPRPRVGERLLESFRAGYRAFTDSTQNAAVSTAFFDEIIREQARRDEASK